MRLFFTIIFTLLFSTQSFAAAMKMVGMKGKTSEVTKTIRVNMYDNYYEPKTINVKKGQFLSPWKVNSIVEKLERAGNENILLTDRGTTFGYESLISDMRSIPIMKETGYPVIFDATHSTQVPGASGGNTGGAREFIPTLAKAAVAAGADGVFMEVHDNVDAARSDAATQWPLDQLENLLISLKKIREAASG